MDELHSFAFTAMGGPCSLHLYAQTPDAAARAAGLAMAEVDRIERRYSRYRSDSLLSDINRTAERGGRIAVDGETAALLDYAFPCHAHSGGLFDISAGVLRAAWDFTSGRPATQAELDALCPRVGLDRIRWRSPWLDFGMAGMELDFGGIAKEYAADRAATLCRTAGIDHGLVELGGDIHVIGPHPDATPWTIGIRHPRQPDALLCNIHIAGGGLAGSGDYARCLEHGGIRYSHLLDPFSGWPVQGGPAAVNVHADCCMVAGSISTIAMLKGAAGAGWLGGLGVPHLWADGAGRVGGPLVSRQRRDDFCRADDAAARKHHRAAKHSPDERRLATDKGLGL